MPCSDGGAPRQGNKTADAQAKRPTGLIDLHEVSKVVTVCIEGREAYIQQALSA